MANHSAVRHSRQSFCWGYSLNSFFRQAISQAHFSNHLDFIDIFLRTDISSLSRAHAFLWLCYHYLEAPSADRDNNYDEDGPSNPFADHRRSNMPSFVFLSQVETRLENNDPPEEIALADKLVAQRAEILRSHGEKESNKALITASAMTLEGDEEVPGNTETKKKGRRGSTKAKASTSIVKKATGKACLPQLKGKDTEICAPAPESEDGYDEAPQCKFGLPFWTQLDSQIQQLPSIPRQTSIHITNIFVNLRHPWSLVFSFNILIGP